MRDCGCSGCVYWRELGKYWLRYECVKGEIGYCRLTKSIESVFKRR